MTKREFDFQYGKYRYLKREKASELSQRWGIAALADNFSRMNSQRWGTFEGWTNKALYEKWLLRQSNKILQGA